MAPNTSWVAAAQTIVPHRHPDVDAGATRRHGQVGAPANSTRGHAGTRGNTRKTVRTDMDRADLAWARSRPGDAPADLRGGIDDHCR